MAEEPTQDEAELALRQGNRVYPVGRALRATYDADNHASLGSDVTGLMLDLARLPYEPGQRRMAAGEPQPCADAAPPRGLFAFVRRLWQP